MDSKGTAQHAASSLDFSQSVEEEPLVDGPVILPGILQSVIRRKVMTLHTHCCAMLLLLLQVVYVSLSVCVCVVCELKAGGRDCVGVLGAVRGLSAVVMGKVCLWGCVLLFGGTDTRRLKHLPLIIHSTGNAAVLILISANVSETEHLPVYLLLGILGLELLVSLPILLIYTVRVVRFNMERAGPDISQEEQTHTYSTTETGFREGSSLEDVVEKQADLIDYLKQHNTLLSKRLLSVTAQP
ncbi:hypothetical protein UPYG_G00050430 [Umbra pygmaea]|uniref:Transmembrane protein 192 n=1 Tax=Umbra pygmaea TaxID=75934 RepID=A0ABD0XRQ3_UMBPY